MFVTSRFLRRFIHPHFTDNVNWRCNRKSVTESNSLVINYWNFGNLYVAYISEAHLPFCLAYIHALTFKNVTRSSVPER